MRRPIHSWKNTLGQLGLVLKNFFASPARGKRPPHRRQASLAFEPLEVRAVLTTSVTISAHDANISEASTAGSYFTLTRDNTSGSLTIPVTVGGSAANGTDYVSIGSSVVFANGSSTAPIALTLYNDSNVEGNEFVSISIDPCLDNSYSIPPLGGYAIITITDDDTAPTVSVTASGTPAEGGASGTYTVSRTGSTAGSLTVSYSMSGSATGGGTDYASLSGSVTIASGQSSANVTLSVVDDSNVEPSESATLSLGWSMNYSVDTMASSATLNILDNDYITVAASGSPSEVGPTNGTYTITRPGSTSGSLMVSYSMSGAAVNGTDYSTLTGSATIASGQSSVAVTLGVTDDTAVEGLEGATLTLNTSSFYTPSPTQGAATLNIADNEFVWVTSSGSPSEQGPTTGTYTIHRPGSTSGSLVISYSMSGTATGSGTDYATLSGSATIASGQSTVDVTLTPVDDALIDAGETSILTLNSGAYTPDPTSASASLTIGDNEVWVTASGNPSEHNETTGTFTFHRNGPTTSSLLVPYSLSGGTHGVDYVAAPNSNPAVLSVLIPANASSVDVVLQPIDDNEREDNEVITATAGAPTGCSVATSNATASLTIDDNDEWTVGIVALEDGTALESGPVPGKFLIYRTDELDLTYDLTVNLAIDEGSTASSADHDFDYSTYVIPAGEASVVINVTPVNDALREDDELLTVNVVSSDYYAIDATDDSATLTIVDNDQWTVGITALVGDAFEAGELPGSFLITRSGQTDFSFALTVNVAVDNASTASSADYDFIYESYEIPAGEASVLVPIVPVDDSTPESNEDLILGLVVDDAYDLADNDSATVTIHDEIPAGWNTVTITADTYPAEEFGPVTRNFTISRTGPTGAALPVGIFIGGTATQGVDYQNLSGTDPAVNYVTIPADQSSVTVTVLPILDQKIEGNETVYVALTSAGDGSGQSTPYVVGAYRDATITITDYTSGPFDDVFYMYTDLNSATESFVLQTQPNVLTNDPVSGTAYLVTGPTYAASFSLNPNGTFQYIPNASWPKEDSFVYKLSADANAPTAWVKLVHTFSYRSIGSRDNSPEKATPGILLEGGGSHPTNALQWFVNHANGGDIVIIRQAIGDLDSTLAGLGTVNSVETIVLDAPNIGAAQVAASNPVVTAIVENAEAVFFGGGDQSLYTKILPGSDVLKAINKHLAAKEIVVGGTSAGMAILAGFIYTGEYGSVTSVQALNDPYHAEISFREGMFLLPAYMTSVITDTHFQLSDRDRMGRSVTFLARMWKMGWPGQRAVSADSGAAVGIEWNGVGEVFGTPYVYFLKTRSPGGTVAGATKLTFATVDVIRLSAGGFFNLADWATVPDDNMDVANYQLDVSAETLRAQEMVNGELVLRNAGIY